MGNQAWETTAVELQGMSERFYYTSNPWPAHLTSYSVNYAGGGRGLSAHGQVRL